MLYTNLDHSYTGRTIRQKWPCPTDENRHIEIEIIHDGGGRDHHVVGVFFDQDTTDEQVDATVADYKDMYGDIS